MSNSYRKNHPAGTNLTFSCRSKSGSEREVSELNVKTYLTIGYPSGSRMGIHNFVSEIWSFLDFYNLREALETDHYPVLRVECDALMNLVYSPTISYEMIYDNRAPTTPESGVEKFTKVSKHFRFGISVSDVLSNQFYDDECYDFNNFAAKFIASETYSKVNDMIDHYVGSYIIKAIEETTEPVDDFVKRFHLDLEKPNDDSYKYREVVPLKNDNVHPRMFSRCGACTLGITLDHTFFIKKELLPFDLTEIDKHYQMFKIHRKLSS